MTRSFAVLMLLALLRGPEISAQSVEAGPLFGDLGRGVRLSTQVSQDWRLNLHGTHRDATFDANRTFGGLLVGVSERVTYGTVGVTARRTLARGWALDLGAWVLMGRRALAVSAASSTLLGAELDSE
ncbi:MAG: hypothetical protein HKN29_15005, partial [Rhodothermales bacterium]|nr:hypothetical protein [Rhodothermales bacterium]